MIGKSVKIFLNSTWLYFNSLSLVKNAVHCTNGKATISLAAHNVQLHLR